MLKFYTTIEALPTIKQLYIVNPKESIITLLNADSKNFAVHVTIQKQEKMPVNLKRHV